MNQVPEFSSESGFGGGVRFDDSEVGCYFREFLEIPPLKVWVGLTGEFSAFPKSCGGARDVRRGTLLKRPEQKGLDGGTCEDCGGFPLTVRESYVDGTDVVSQVCSEIRVGDEVELRGRGGGALIRAFCKGLADKRHWIEAAKGLTEIVRDVEILLILPNQKFVSDCGDAAYELSVLSPGQGEQLFRNPVD